MFNKLSGDWVCDETDLMIQLLDNLRPISKIPKNTLNHLFAINVANIAHEFQTLEE